MINAIVFSIVLFYPISFSLWASSTGNVIPNVVAFVGSFLLIFRLYLYRVKITWPKELVLFLLLFFYVCVWYSFTYLSSEIFNSYALTMFFFCLLYLSFYENPKLAYAYIYGYIIGVSGSLLRSIVQFGSLIPDGTERLSGEFTNSNWFALSMVFGFAMNLCLLGHVKSLLLKLVIVATSCLFAIQVILNTGSKKGILLLIIALVYTNWSYIKSARLSNKIAVLLFTSLILFSGYNWGYKYIEDSPNINRIVKFYDHFTSSETDASTDERVRMFDKGLDLWQKNFIFGVGWGGYKELSGFGTYSHNNYIQLLSELGVLGFILYYFGIAVLYFDTRKMEDVWQKKLVLLILLIVVVNDFTVVSFYNKNVILFFPVLRGLIAENSRRVIHNVG